MKRAALLMSVSVLFSYSLFAIADQGSSLQTLQGSIQDNAVEQSIQKEAQEDENCCDGMLIARRGCCSHHGGVCGCDKSSDRIVCCDGSLSPSCTCSGY